MMLYTDIYASNKMWPSRSIRMEDKRSVATPMALARYYMRRMAMQVEDEHFQELCRTVAYAIHPAQAAYQIAVQFGVNDLPTPEEVFRTGVLPD
jgi:hypothetical protein